MAEIVIKQGDFKLVVPRDQLVQVDETHDGIAFQFKGGLQLYKTDPFMPQSVKQLMKQTADSYPEKKLVFELNNPRKPVYVDAT